ncbi:hypothetical protein L6164_032067 [Bauhinia variegata]|uniref:Uncharacterized protein n=1 Tax=Bauhinia variegata TaxID=167791 RepID=A0ACB9KML9_BAUVA|nr:hypothetical protein L6164_032067 [Bauhinia variegata]
MAGHSLFFCLILTLVSLLHGIHGVEFEVRNTVPTSPGGTRFNNELGVDYTKQTMQESTNFIWNLFQQNTEADRKNLAQVILIVEEREGIAATSNNEIYFGAGYINGIQGDIKTDFNGVLYHEMTHVWQWFGSGYGTNPGLFEGIADFVRLKAGYAPAHWRKPGEGDSWNQGYEVTAHFLDYCESLRSGFVAELNKKSRTSYSDDYFVQLLGKTVDQLWSDYKAKYSGGA